VPRDFQGREGKGERKEKIKTKKREGGTRSKIHNNGSWIFLHLARIFRPVKRKSGRGFREGQGHTTRTLTTRRRRWETRGGRKISVQDDAVDGGKKPANCQPPTNKQQCCEETKGGLVAKEIRNWLTRQKENCGGGEGNVKERSNSKPVVGR